MTLGWRPKQESIVLSRSADFIMSREARNITVPAGTTARIQWSTSGGNVQWNGTVTGNTVSWNVEAATADLIQDGTKFTIFVSYPGAGGNRDDYVWMTGRCRRTN